MSTSLRLPVIGAVVRNEAVRAIRDVPLVLGDELRLEGAEHPLEIFLVAEQGEGSVRAVGSHVGPFEAKPLCARKDTHVVR
jgi:hypothetical protein